MDLELVRLALGAFLTSPGFGGLMAGAGVVVALRQASEERLTGERARTDAMRLEEQNDERDRWWRMFTWLDANASSLDGETFLRMWRVLDDSAPSQGLAMMLVALDARMKAEWASADEAQVEEREAPQGADNNEI